MGKLIACVVVVGLALSGCATKRYPIATPLSAGERSVMTCRELQLELARGEEVQRQIVSTAQVDWRSVAGFLGDYGIGNVMARSEAEKAVSKRMADIREAQADKRCFEPGAGGDGLAKFFGRFFR